MALTTLGLSSIPARQIETRAIEPSWAALRGGVDLGSTHFVSPYIAENLSTVTACVGAISSAIASLPAYIYRTDAGERVIDTAHPVSRLIARETNEQQTWSDFIEWLMSSVLLRGNALAEIVTDGRGAVIALKPIPFQNANIALLPNGRLTYDVTDQTSVGGTGRTRRLLQDQLLHIRDRSDDGVIGRSRLQRAAAVVQVGASIQNYADHLYGNAASPSGAISFQEELSAEGFEMIRQRVQRLYQRPQNAGRVIVLDKGMTWQSLSFTPEDAEFLQSRRFSVEELCRVFGVPPVIVGDLSNGTFSNTETLVRFFAQSTLAPWIKKIEAAFARSVLTPGRELEIDLSGLLRGDSAARWSAWKIAVETGVLTPAQVAAEEGFAFTNTAGTVA